MVTSSEDFSKFDTVDLISFASMLLGRSATCGASEEAGFMDHGMGLSVYLGNIPYDYTEEQVMEIAQSVGPVDDLKLLFDPNTGKSKGYAFVKYVDHETAESAVRNLNNFLIGNRNIKCSLSNENDPFMNDSFEVDKLPPLPLGVQIFPPQTTSQIIANILSTLDQQSASKLIKEAKDMASTNPLLMEKLLERTPQLAHALVETLLLLNLTKPEIIEICVNRRKQEIPFLTADQISLLKLAKELNEDELEDLDEGKKSIMNKLISEINSGSFGQIS